MLSYYLVVRSCCEYSHAWYILYFLYTTNHLETGFCDAEFLNGMYWEESMFGEEVIQPCPIGSVLEGGVARRLCKSTGSWDSLQLEECGTGISYALLSQSDTIEAMASY